MLSEMLDTKRGSRSLLEAIGLIGRQVKLITASGLGQVVATAYSMSYPIA